MPWYTDYFSEHYWRFATQEYSDDRTAAELSYILAFLRQHAPGHRVADLGCGLGRHAIPLAQAGFALTAVDVSEWVLNQVSARAAASGVAVRCVPIDLLIQQAWPIGEVDAAICLQFFGLGADAWQRRFLRNVRRHLAPNGVLLLEHSNPFWIARHYCPDAIADQNGVTFEFRRQYDPVTGRNSGEMVVTDPASPERVVLRHDTRLYTTPEVVSMMRQAGFEIVRVDADLATDGSVTLDTRYVQVVARAAASIETGLAIGGWHRRDGEVGLDLRWSPDEVEWAKPSPYDVWEDLHAGPARYAADVARRYSLDDPYGSRAAGALSEHFGCELPPALITPGAGTTALIRQLASLADGGPVLSGTLTHPDLTVWAAEGGSEILLLDEAATVQAMIAAVRTYQPSLVHLDRPTIAGDLMPSGDVVSIAEAAAAAGALVIVDEASCSYFAGALSAVPLVLGLDNLIVLRSVSKAYAWGGLRAGFAFASAAIAGRVRALVASLQVSELSLQMAIRLFASGDMFQPLRHRVRQVKCELAGLLKAAGVEALEGHPELPWVLVRDPDGSAWTAMKERNILAKRLITAASLRGQPIGLLKVAVPLSDHRLALMRRYLAGPR